MPLKRQFGIFRWSEYTSSNRIDSNRMSVFFVQRIFTRYHNGARDTLSTVCDWCWMQHSQSRTTCAQRSEANLPWLSYLRKTLAHEMGHSNKHCNNRKGQTYALWNTPVPHRVTLLAAECAWSLVQRAAAATRGLWSANLAFLDARVLQKAENDKLVTNTFKKNSSRSIEWVTERKEQAL